MSWRYGEEPRPFVVHPTAAERERQKRFRETVFQQPCGRCEDTGLVLWCGKKDQGGRVGPCPSCHPYGAKRFCTDLARETFPEPDIVARARRFDKTFARGVNHGRP